MGPTCLTFWVRKNRLIRKRWSWIWDKSGNFEISALKNIPAVFLPIAKIDVVLELRKKHNLSFKDIEKIEVHASPADEWCNRPEPHSLGDLQFSFQHLLGAAMLDGDVNFENVDVDVLSDPRYREARSKVEVIIHPDRSPVLVQAPAEVVIKKRDGTHLSGQRMFTIGSLQEPLSVEQYIQLYSKFAKGILTHEQIEKSVEAILNLERLNDVMGLMDLLTTRDNLL